MVDRQTEIQTCVPQNGMKYNTEVSLNTELKGTPNTMWAHTKSGYIKMAQQLWFFVCLGQ